MKRLPKFSFPLVFAAAALLSSCEKSAELIAPVAKPVAGQTKQPLDVIQKWGKADAPKQTSDVIQKWRENAAASPVVSKGDPCWTW